MTSLDEMLCEKFIAACRRELNNSRMTLAAANEKHTACYNALVREQQRLMKCSQAYKTVYEQNEQMMNEMHSLTTTNVSLRQELERAYKTIESSHTQNVKLETLLNGMTKTMNEIDSVAGPGRDHSTEELETRIMTLKKRLKMKEERRAELLKAFNHTIVAEGNPQKFERLYETASSIAVEQSSSLIESKKGEALKKHKSLKESRRQKIRKFRNLRIVCF